MPRLLPDCAQPPTSIFPGRRFTPVCLCARSLPGPDEAEHSLEAAPSPKWLARTPGGGGEGLMNRPRSCGVPGPRPAPRLPSWPPRSCLLKRGSALGVPSRPSVSPCGLQDPCPDLARVCVPLASRKRPGTPPAHRNVHARAPRTTGRRPRAEHALRVSVSESPDSHGLLAGAQGAGHPVHLAAISFSAGG